VKKLLAMAALALVIAVQAPVGAQNPKRKAEMSVLVGQMMEPGLIAARGAFGGKVPLGQYLVEPHTVYRSGYEKVSPAAMARWALALHDYVKLKGGGYAKYQEYVAASGKKEKLYPAFGTMKDEATDGPLEKAHVKYSWQKDFAKVWWGQQDQGYAKAVMKDWWLNDAVLDGTVLWTAYEANEVKSADAHAWRDAELAKMVKKK
jgi:hypothetical protein